MALNIKPPDFEHTFVPEAEKLELESNPKYLPFSIKTHAMTGPIATAFRSEASNTLKQEEHVKGVGKKATSVIKSSADLAKFRMIQEKYANQLIIGITNIGFYVSGTGEEKHYPVVTEGKLIETWCTSKELIEQIVSEMPQDILSEYLDFIQEASFLSDSEKKR